MASSATTSPSSLHLFSFLHFVLHLTSWAGCQGSQREYEKLNSRLEVLRYKIRRRPGDFENLVWLATSLHQLDHEYPDGGSRVPEAEAAYREAISKAPDAATASMLQGNLGALFMSAGRLQDALDMMEEGIASGAAAGLSGTSEYPGWLFNKGKALGTMGREEDAQASYRQALAAARGTAPATWTKACAAMTDVTQDELRDMESAATYLSFGTGIAAAVSSQQHAQEQETAAQLAREWSWLEPASPIDRSWLYFALYAVHDVMGNYDKAWACLTTANQLQKGSQMLDDKARDESLYLALKSVFQPLKTGREAGSYEALLAGRGGFQDETPIFVVGMARSGSTLVEQILASHPRVHGAGEDTALAPLLPQLLTVLEGQGGQLSLRQVARLGQMYVDTMRQKVQKSSGRPLRIVDKMLRNAWNLGYIAMILPKAKFLWAVRHPMDVVLSCYAQPFEGRGTPWAWDLGDIAHQVELTHGIMEHWESILPGRILRVPYEELVTDQESVSRKLLAHCKLAWDPAVLRFHATERNVQTASNSQVRKQLYRSAMGRWKRYAKGLKPALTRLKPLVDQYERILLSLEVGTHHSSDEL